MGINAYLTWYWLGEPRGTIRVYGRNTQGLRDPGSGTWLGLGRWILDTNTPFG